MLRRGFLLVVLVLVGAVFAQTASADPTNAKQSITVTVVCDGTVNQAVVNGNGEFTPGHLVGSTAVFVPTAFDLTFSFTPTGGATMSDTETAAKANQRNTITCQVPLALNTLTSPEGTFSISGTVSGFLTPGR
jgi:hypothetical protein